MRLLLDTHTLLWWLEDHPSLSNTARQALGDAQNALFVSAISALEVTIKYRIGKLPHVAYLVDDFAAISARVGLKALPVSLDHAVRAGMLSFAHKDPFDRVLIAQALVDELTLVSNERLFDETGVSRLW